MIELLVVVVIVSALAAVVVPNFSDVSAQSEQSYAAHQEKVVQSAIDRYFAEHGSFPHRDMWQVWCTSISGDYRRGTGYTFLLNRLKLYSNAAGEVCDSRQSGKYPLGPYLSKDIPENPLTNSAVVLVLPSSINIGETGSSYGWVYDSDNGMFTSVE